MKVNRSSFIKLYNYTYKNTLTLYKNKEYHKVMDAISLMANMAYNINSFYTDDTLEEFIDRISLDFVKRNKDIIPTENKWIFYDSFGWDNRGLTQQYIRALISWNVEFLFIFENFSEDLSKEILLELKNYNKAHIYIIDNTIPIEERLNKLVTVIENYNPSKAFLHLTPWNPFSFLLWNRFEDIERFQINLTDHAFWIGKKCFDYCIEFRDYGYNVSLKHRGIPKEKLLLAPFYPIVDSQNTFQGFPQKVEHKKLIISGASFYKIFGENDMFFKLMKNICNQHEDAIILFAGNGDYKLFNKLLEKYELIDKVILLGDRADISEVVKRAYIYLATYPIGGGLMGQFAIQHKIPIVAYTDKSFPNNNIECFLKPQKGLSITTNSMDEFLTEFHKLYTDFEYRKTTAERNYSLLIQPNEFNIQLQQIVNNKKLIRDVENIDIDIIRFSNLYLNIENKYLHHFKYLFPLIVKLNINKFPYIKLIQLKLSFFSFLRRLKTLILSTKKC